MLISFDENHLLSIQNPSLAQLKPYSYTLSGWSFSSFDKEIFVYYKRSRKLINFKNLGDGMQVAYLKSDFLPLSYGENKSQKSEHQEVRRYSSRWISRTLTVT